MYNYNAKLIGVVDGDTVDLEVDLGFDVHMRGRFRLYGINAPESRTSDKAEKARGRAAKDFLIKLLAANQGSPVRVTTHKDEKEKYGRYLAELFVSVDDSGIRLKDGSVSHIMIDRGHAVEYLGGKR